MIAMEIDVIPSTKDESFYLGSGKTGTFMHGFEEQLSVVAKTVELIFEMGESPCRGTPIPKSEDGRQSMCKGIFAVRLRNFYSALLGLMECFTPTRSNGSQNECLFSATDCKGLFHSTSKVGERLNPTLASECFPSDFNYYPSEMNAKRNKESDEESRSQNLTGSSSSSLSSPLSTSVTSAATISAEISTNRVERPRTLSLARSTDKRSGSQESTNEFIQRATLDGREPKISFVQSRKSSRRFVTTAVTGAEIAAAYQTLAAATFRRNDFARSEKNRHSSFVSRGTSTPRKKEDFFSLLTQSLPSLPPHFDVTSDDILKLIRKSYSRHQQQQQQQQQQQRNQITPLTKDASTSSDVIPHADKAVQVRHGEILEPLDRIPSRTDRCKRRQGVRGRLQKILEESDNDFECSTETNEPSFFNTSTYFDRRSRGPISLYGKNVHGTTRHHDGTEASESAQGFASCDHLRRELAAPPSSGIDRVDTSTWGRRTIEYFFSSKL